MSVEVGTSMAEAASATEGAEASGSAFVAQELPAAQRLNPQELPAIQNLIPQELSAAKALPPTQSLDGTTELVQTDEPVITNTVAEKTSEAVNPLAWAAQRGKSVTRAAVATLENPQSIADAGERELELAKARAVLETDIADGLLDKAEAARIKTLQQEHPEAIGFISMIMNLPAKAREVVFRALEKGSTPVKALTLGFALLTADVACGGAPATPTPIVVEQNPDATKTPVITIKPTEKATPSPTEAPTLVTAGFTQNADGGITWKGPDKSGGEVDLGVPAIDGLQAVLKDGKVTYEAQAGNKYGLEAGAYAGEYQPYVSVEGKLTGGDVLEPQVVSQLIKDKLATISNPADKWIAPVPLNITDATADTDLNITFTKGYHVEGMPDIGIASISFAGELPVTSIEQHSQVIVTADSFYGWAYFDPEKNPLSSISATNPITDLMVAGSFEGFTAQTTVKAAFGETVCTATGPIIVTLQAGMEWRDLTSDDMLYVTGPDGSDIPVFVAHNPDANLSAIHIPATDLSPATIAVIATKKAQAA
jgi:hypothetical protein